MLFVSQREPSEEFIIAGIPQSNPVAEVVFVDPEGPLETGGLQLARAQRKSASRPLVQSPRGYSIVSRNGLYAFSMVREILSSSMVASLNNKPTFAPSKAHEPRASHGSVTNFFRQLLQGFILSTCFNRSPGRMDIYHLRHTYHKYWCVCHVWGNECGWAAFSLLLQGGGWF